MEGKTTQLQWKVDAMEPKIDAMEIGSSLVFGNEFGFAMTLCFVVAFFGLINYLFMGSSALAIGDCKNWKEKKIALITTETSLIVISLFFFILR